MIDITKPPYNTAPAYYGIGPMNYLSGGIELLLIVGAIFAWYRLLNRAGAFPGMFTAGILTILCIGTLCDVVKAFDNALTYPLLGRSYYIQGWDMGFTVEATVTERIEKSLTTILKPLPALFTLFVLISGTFEAFLFAVTWGRLYK